jgi:uncharacterized membrane protein
VVERASIPIELDNPGAIVKTGKARWRRMILVGGTAVFGFQLLFLLANSLRIYHRFALTQDFASYYQAWFLIAHGHFSPYDSIFGMPFLKSHFELLLWPLFLIYWLYPHGVTLLWLQDLAMVGAEIVALLWALDAMDRHPDLGLPPRVVASAGMVALLVLNPWFYRSAAFDFHLEAFATLFAVLAARNMYGGRHPRALLWVAVLLLCGDLGGLYAAGLGLSAILSGR